jgi:hypothetical protein
MVDAGPDARACVVKALIKSTEQQSLFFIQYLSLFALLKRALSDAERDDDGANLALGIYAVDKCLKLGEGLKQSQQLNANPIAEKLKQAGLLDVFKRLDSHPGFSQKCAQLKGYFVRDEVSPNGM